MSGTTEISKKVGVSVRTLQYYDDEGLLVLERISKNYHMYDEDTLRRIWEFLSELMEFGIPMHIA